jgi:HD-like signal output (HDOD) protein
MEINLKKEIKLPSPPAIAIRILEAVKDCHSTSCSLAQIVSADPA